jgi:hypothetical protein
MVHELVRKVGVRQCGDDVRDLAVEGKLDASKSTVSKCAAMLWVVVVAGVVVVTLRLEAAHPRGVVFDAVVQERGNEQRLRWRTPTKDARRHGEDVLEVRRAVWPRRLLAVAMDGPIDGQRDRLGIVCSQ